MSRAEAGATGHPQQAPPPEVEGPVLGPAESADSAGEGKPPWPGWEPAARAGGVLVSVLAAFFSGVFELLLTPLRAGDFGTVWRGAPIGSGGGPVVGVSIVLAVVVNYALGWFAETTTGRRWAVGPPWALWTLIMMLAAGTRTTEGDYLVGGNDWIALVTILAGSLSFAVYAYRMILRRLTPPN